jgi:very-short-patch-repair endonuclease
MVDQRPKWHVSEKQRGTARAVRREMTEAERIIWCNVRGRRFQGVSSRRQAVDGPCVIDKVCHAANLTVDVDGGQHFAPKAVLRDARRDTYLAAQRCGAVRFNPLDIMKNKAGVLEQVAVALGGWGTFSRTLRRAPGHAAREDAP